MRPKLAAAARDHEAARVDLAALIDAFADLVAERIAARVGKTEAPRFYTKANLPPAAASWRAARETASREGIAIVRSGRDALIVAAAWDAYLERRTSRRSGHSPEIRSGDEAALKAMGVELVAPGGKP